MVFNSLKRRLQKHTNDNETKTPDPSTNVGKPDFGLQFSSTDSSTQSSSHQFNPTSKPEADGTTESSDPPSTQPTMRAVAITAHGGLSTLTSTHLPKPPAPKGHDLLVRIRGSSVNPIDTKIRNGTYDDYQSSRPESDPTAYFSSAPPLPQILGYDASGTIEAIGELVSKSNSGLKVGDEVFYTGDPRRQGSNAEFQLVDSRVVGRKPEKLDFVEAASMPLTWITAWEALVERLEIPEPGTTGSKPEHVGILIVNGAGGVGSLASQIARHVLQLPVVICTASRPETEDFCREMGATHVVNHREDVSEQIDELRSSGALDPAVPIKYVFVTSRTEQYLETAAEVAAPFGKVCSIVQTTGKTQNRGSNAGSKAGRGRKDGDAVAGMYGTQWMAKSLTFVWELVGTKAVYGVELESQGRILRRLSELVEDGTVRCHMNHQLPATEEGIRKAHEMQESGIVIGKIGIGKDGSKGAPGFEDSMF